jgi:hypothetical protein
VVKKINAGYFAMFLVLTLVTGCHKYDMFNGGNINSQSGTDILSKNIIIDEDSFNSISKDEFLIQDSYINDDSLVLTIEYVGGCGIFEYDLVTDGAFMESYPVQLNIAVSFEDDDTCEALVREQLSFNLSNLADYYFELYRTDHGSIIMHLENFEESLVYSF